MERTSKSADGMAAAAGRPKEPPAFEVEPPGDDLLSSCLQSADVFMRLQEAVERSRQESGAGTSAEDGQAARTRQHAEGHNIMAMTEYGPKQGGRDDLLLASHTDVRSVRAARIDLVCRV